MMIDIHLVAIVLCSVLAVPAFAQNVMADTEQLAKVVAIDVRILTSFTAGSPCEPDADTLTTEAELILRQSGIAVTKSSYTLQDLLHADITLDERADAHQRMPHWFVAQFVGVELPGGCATSFYFSLYRREVTADLSRTTGTPGFVHAFTRPVGIWTGPTRDAQNTIRQLVRETTTSLADEILKARQQKP